MSRQAVAAVGALAASVLFGAAPAVGEEVAFSPIRVRLEFIRASPMTDEALEALTAETAAIWAPHGVAVLPAPAGPALDEGGGDDTIKVILRDAPANRIDGRTPTGYRGLASVVFVDPSTPGQVIFASLESALETVRAAKLARWPAHVQERLATRLLGRAIAHELGHYLLRSRDHSRRGLMRASFDERDVVVNDLAGFRLLPEQAAALPGRAPHGG